MAEKEIQIVYTVPNQKVVKVMHDICNENHIYTQCNVKSNKRAIKELSPNAYKLYMYFALNHHEYTFALSSVDVQNTTGMSDTTYKKCVRELIEKEYLVKSKTKGLYIFYEGTQNSPDRRVKTNRQEEENNTTENKKETVQKVKKNSSRGVETNREILQDNIKNNTLNNTDADAQTVASLSASTMPLKEFDFKSDSSFSDRDMAKIIGNFIKQGHSKTDVITEFTSPKGWYKCSNEQAVSDCYDYLTKAD